MSHFVQVTTAAETRDAGLDLVRSAVRERLAGSGQVVGPVASVFWHLGEFGEGEEWLIVLKTTSDQYSSLEKHLIEHHPWENPEIVAVAIESGSSDYLKWLKETVEGQQ